MPWPFITNGLISIVEASKDLNALTSFLEIDKSSSNWEEFNSNCFSNFSLLVMFGSTGIVFEENIFSAFSVI